MLDSKKCGSCHIFKDILQFHKHKRMKDGVSSFCKTCAIDKSRAYRKTKNGLSSQLFNHQKNKSKKRNHLPPKYSALEFREWLFNEEGFEKMFTRWVASGYNSDLTPSADRMDNSKGYSFDNIKLMTWEENNNNGKRDMFNGKIESSIIPKVKVKQFTLDGALINIFESMTDASRTTKINHSLISCVCSGKYKTGGGYLWEYA